MSPLQGDEYFGSWSKGGARCARLPLAILFHACGVRRRTRTSKAPSTLRSAGALQIAGKMPAFRTQDACAPLPNQITRRLLSITLVCLAVTLRQKLFFAQGLR